MVIGVNLAAILWDVEADQEGLVGGKDLGPRGRGLGKGLCPA